MHLWQCLHTPLVQDNLVASATGARQCYNLDINSLFPCLFLQSLPLPPPRPPACLATLPDPAYLPHPSPPQGAPRSKFHVTWSDLSFLTRNIGLLSYGPEGNTGPVMSLTLAGGPPAAFPHNLQLHLHQRHLEPSKPR